MTDTGPLIKQDAVISLVDEQVVVTKTEVETGRVRISTHVEERTEHVRESLQKHGVDVQRVAINRIVDEPPVVRKEGGALIYPIVEEVLVKRLLLKEELHITETATVDLVERDVTLRTLHADVERTPTTASKI